MFRVGLPPPQCNLSRNNHTGLLQVTPNPEGLTTEIDGGRLIPFFNLTPKHTPLQSVKSYSYVGGLDVPKQIRCQLVRVQEIQVGIPLPATRGPVSQA